MKKRDLSFDLLRVLAILGVVLIHADNITASKTNYLGGFSWWFVNTIHSLAIISVPIFVMISGALIFNKNKLSLEYVFNKVSYQFLPPLLFWSAFYFQWHTGNFFITDLHKFLNNFFYSNLDHLYFLQIIIGLYLFAPLIHNWVHKKDFPNWLLTLGASLAVGYEYLSFTILKTYNQTNMIYVFLPFLVYFIWGFYLSKIKLKGWQWWAYFVFALLLTVGISYLTFVNTNSFNQGNTMLWTPSGGNSFWEPFTLPVLLLSMLVFILIRNIEVIFPNIFKFEKANILLAELSKASFGVYLIHPFVMDQIDHFFNLAVHLTSLPLWFYYLYRSGIVFVLSTIFIILISRIRIFNILIGVRSK